MMDETEAPKEQPDTPPNRWPLIKSKLKNISLRYWFGILFLFTYVVLPLPLVPTDLAPTIGLLYLMMFAVSWDIVSGYTGQLSFGHAYFFAIGGYGSTILNVQHGVHPLLSILLATLAAAIGGFIIGLPALRLQGPYLSLITLVVPLIMIQSFVIWNTSLIIDIGGIAIPVAPDGFGGQIGLPTPPTALISTRQEAVLTVSTYRMQVLGNYYLSLALMIAMIGVLFLITKTTVGSVFTAIREDENAVSASGLNPAKFKLYAFVLSGTVGGLAAAVYVHTMAGFPQPSELLNIQLSINVVIMGVLGGMGTLLGPVVGAGFFATIEALTSFFNFTIPVVGVELNQLTAVIIYVLAILTLYYLPEGLVPAYVRIGRRLLAWYRGEDYDGEHQSDSETPLGQAIAQYRDTLEDIRDRDRTNE